MLRIPKLRPSRPDDRRPREAGPRRARRRRGGRLDFDRLEGRTLLSAGDLDPTFGVGGLAVNNFGFTDSGVPWDDRAESVALQADGKIVVAGSTSFWADDLSAEYPSLLIARYNANGTLDTGFGTGGRTTIPFPEPSWVLNPAYGLDFWAGDVAIQGDGKIVIVGGWKGAVSTNGTELVRLAPDGLPDATFGQGGVVVSTHISNPARDYWTKPSVALQSDGRILVTSLLQGQSWYLHAAIARFNADGSPDDGSDQDSTPGDRFGTGGIAIPPSTDTEEMLYPGGISIQSDGEILLVGTAFDPAGTAWDPDNPYTSTGRFALARFHADGSPDMDFGSCGLSTPDFGTGMTDVGRDVAVQPDGKILITGDSESWDGYFDEFVIARVNADGSPDTTFYGTGLHAINFLELDPYPISPPQDIAASLALQSDGRIVVSGLSFGYADPDQQRYLSLLAVARFTPDGDLDPSFGVGGKIATSLGSQPPSFVADPIGYALAIQADGNVVVAGGGDFGLTAGEWSNPSEDLFVARFLGGPLGIVGPTQVSDQLRALERTVSQAGQMTGIKLTATSGTQASLAIDAVAGLSATTAGSSLTVTLDLGSASVMPGGSLSAPAGVSLVLTGDGGAVVDGATVAGGTVYVGAGVTPTNWTVDGGTVYVQGGYSGDFTVHAGATVYFSDGTVITGHSPALVVDGGTVILRGVTARTDTDSPTILVRGGTLIVRGSVIQESTGFARPAIEVDGGLVDLGTAVDPGGNTINVNGAGEPVRNTSTTPVAAVGTAFAIDGVAMGPSSLSGVVFEDFNADGQVDFGERGIAGVSVALDGVDFLGAPVHLAQVTDGDGAYVFAGLRPGRYALTESQPAGYAQGIDTPGTAGGTVAGDRFDLYLAASLDALNYNYGERPAATGAIRQGQTAGIGFWNNKNGQTLIRALNGGPTSTHLGSWLSATFPHMFGASAGSSNLAGRTNADIATFFQGRFVLKDQKLDAQVLATALAVYVTDGTLDGTGAGTKYGFTVGGDGVATATVSVGANGAAFGVADGTVMTVMDLLLAADAQAVNGVLYNGNTVRRTKANAVFGAVNQAGGL